MAKENLVVLESLGKKAEKLKGICVRTNAIVKGDLDGKVIVTFRDVNSKDAKNLYGEIKAIFGRKASKKYYQEYSTLQAYITC